MDWMDWCSLNFNMCRHHLGHGNRGLCSGSLRGAWVSVFLTSSQGMPMLLVPGTVGKCRYGTPGEMMGAASEDKSQLKP